MALTLFPLDASTLIGPKWMEVQTTKKVFVALPIAQLQVLILNAIIYVITILVEEEASSCWLESN